MANLVRDFDILKMARDAAFDILTRDPRLIKKEHQALRDELMSAYGPTALAGIG